MAQTNETRRAGGAAGLDKSFFLGGSDNRDCPPKLSPPQAQNRLRGIDFEAVNRAALAVLPAVLARLIPGGKIVAREYAALNPTRADRHVGSFKVNLRSGRWADFATGDKGGDPVSLVAYLECVSQVDAARRLARMLGIEIGGRRMDDAFERFAPVSEEEKAAGFSASAPNAHEEEGERVSPIPSDAPAPPETHRALGKPSQLWTYRDASGETLFYVCRFDPAGERKQFMPLTYGAKARPGSAMAGWGHAGAKAAL